MKRYWFKIKNDGHLPIGIPYGCGITAMNLEDAKGILKAKVFKDKPFEIESYIEDVDVSTLDANHVLVNMHPTNLRGVWFPMGYQ